MIYMRQEGIEKIEQTTVATAAGLATMGEGAAIGAVAGAIFGPVGAAIGGCNVLYIGGGATIMRRFGAHKDNVAYLEDIRLNAKGYELLAAHQMKRG